MRRGRILRVRGCWRVWIIGCRVEIRSHGLRERQCADAWARARGRWDWRNCWPRPIRATRRAIPLAFRHAGRHGTHWQASYRWQPEVYIYQRCAVRVECRGALLEHSAAAAIHSRSDGTGGLQALIDLRNLLAQGYRPYLLSDGSLLFFAQDQRGITRRAGVYVLGREIPDPLSSVCERKRRLG